MLNISKQQVKTGKNEEEFESFRELSKVKYGKSLTYWLYTFFGLSFLVLFIPWTQNIRSTGSVTTLFPNERPQTIQSAIDGRIEKWYVREGDYVNPGDTIVHISEIKDDYFDPELVDRTKMQLEAKEATVESYIDKVQRLEEQIEALEDMQRYKLQQARNKIRQTALKVTADSIDFEAAKVNYGIAVDQLDRQEKLYEQGLKSLTQVEARRNKLQQEQAKRISSESKLLSSRNQLINARIELSTLTSEFGDKLAKARSDRASALSARYTGEGEVVKLRNTLTNYEQRVLFRHIVSPRAGFITQVRKAGIGENVKQGEQILTIVDNNSHRAASLYIDPVDLPLIRLGQPVRLEFDGWPAIVFSGWPNLSFGTYPAKVVAIDNSISGNNKYRILVAPEEESESWPELVRFGSGVQGFALLNDVPIWYELWRQLNGFPPDFYIDLEQAESEAHIDKGMSGGDKSKKK